MPTFRRRLPGPTTSARLVLGGVVLYVALDTALLFLRPQFSFLHNAESDYGSRGSWDWLMDLNFLLRCALSLAAVRALRLARDHRGSDLRFGAGLALLSIWALASGLLAFFPDDPVGTPTHGTGTVHVVLAFVAFLAVLLGTISLTRALRVDPRWAAVGVALTVLAYGALIPILLLGHSHFRRHTLGGLYEKLFLAVELLWMVAAVAPQLALGPARPSAGGGRRRWAAHRPSSG